MVSCETARPAEQIQPQTGKIRQIVFDAVGACSEIQ
jgi:hypothetical protein